jgi:hypothetical protein
VVPRTPYGVTDDQPVGERAVVVGAMRTDGKDLVPPPYQDRFVVADAAGDGAAVREIANWDAVLEVWL